jgi:hypothetical protein
MKTWLGYRRPRLAQPDNKRLLSLVDSEQRGVADNERGNNDNSNNASEEIGSHYRPPLCGWLRG